MRQAKSAHDAGSGGAANVTSYGRRKSSSTQHESEENTFENQESIKSGNSYKEGNSQSFDMPVVFKKAKTQDATTEMKKEDDSELEGTKREEIDPKVQEHLKQEFEIYCEHKFELIEKGEDLLPSKRKKELTKEKKIAKFQRRINIFENLMEGRKRSFWGTKRYDFLLKNLFPDYGEVIHHKVESVKNEIGNHLTAATGSIDLLINALKDAIAKADTNTAEAQKILDKAQAYHDKGTEQKKSAENTLKEYGGNNDIGNNEVILLQYGDVLTKYQLIISILSQNIEEVGSKKFQFNGIVAELSAQKIIINDLNTKVSATEDVQELISIQDNAFSELKANLDNLLAETRQVDLDLPIVNGVELNSDLDSGKEEIGVLDNKVEEIKQAEIKRREEEEARRLKEEEEERKRREREAAIPSIFIKKNSGTVPVKTTAKSQVSNKAAKPKQSEYTEKRWGYVGALDRFKTNTNDNRLTEEKDYFDNYKRVADNYLAEYYKEQAKSNKFYNPKYKLTGDMFVSAAKKIYLNYGNLDYIAPVELVLVQGRVENNLGMSHNGIKAYNNTMNVGVKDDGPEPWVDKMTSPELGIYFYMDLLAHDYLSDKTPDQLLERYANEKGSRYATAKYYEIDLKGSMGQVGLVSANKRPVIKKIGRGAKENDTKPDAIFVRQMLTQLGYNQPDLGDAIAAFQAEEMKPIDGGPSKYIDGWISPKGYTVGVLYYLTHIKNNSGTVSSSSVGTVSNNGITAQEGSKAVQALYKKYSDDPKTLGEKLVPYSRDFASDVIKVMDSLGAWGMDDDLAIGMVNKTDDHVLSYFDRELLKRMETALNPANNFIDLVIKTEKWERVKKALGTEYVTPQPVISKGQVVDNTSNSGGSPTTVEDTGTVYNTKVEETDPISIWANKTGASNKEYATLIFEAEKLGLIKINHSITRRTLTEVKDGKAITGAKTKTDYHVFYTTWRIIQNWTKKWILAGRKGAKPNLEMGSMMHYEPNKDKEGNLLPAELRTTRHGTGQALDINGMIFTAIDNAAIDEVISIIDGLPPGEHVMGVPLQGQFFKQSDYIGNVINNVSGDQATGLAFHTTKTVKLTKENGKWPEQAGQKIKYHKKFKVNGKWVKDSDLPSAGGKAIDYLQSSKLKEKIKLINARENTSLGVMPDYNNHLHIQMNKLKLNH